jgi:hypothetical protein
VTLRKIKIKKEYTNNYNDSKIYFSFVNKEMDQVCLKFHLCRDYLHDAVRCHVHNKSTESFSNHQYYPGKNPPLDMENIRLVVTSFPNKNTFKFLKVKEKVWWEDFKTGLYTGKRAINAFEEEMGLSKKSTVKQVKIDISNIKKAWLLVGPGEWMRNPHLLSVYTFLLRVYITLGQEKHFETVEEVENGLINNVTEINNKINYGNIVCNCWNKLALILKNRDDIFPPEEDFKLLFPESPAYSFHSSGGINSLCLSRTSVNSVNENMKMFLKDNAKRLKKREIEAEKMIKTIKKEI